MQCTSVSSDELNHCSPVHCRSWTSLSDESLLEKITIFVRLASMFALSRKTSSVVSSCHPVNLIWIGPLDLSLRFTKYVYVHLLDAVCSLKHLCFYINFYITLLQNSVAVKNCAYSCNVWSAVVNVYLHYIHCLLFIVYCFVCQKIIQIK